MNIIFLFEKWLINKVGYFGTSILGAITGGIIGGVLVTLIMFAIFKK